MMTRQWREREPLATCLLEMAGVEAAGLGRLECVSCTHPSVSCFSTARALKAFALPFFLPSLHLQTSDANHPHLVCPWHSACPSDGSPPSTSWRHRGRAFRWCTCGTATAIRTPDCQYSSWWRWYQLQYQATPQVLPST